LKKEEFVNEAEEAYDKATALVQAGDDEKIIGRLEVIAEPAQNGNTEAILEVLAITAVGESMKEKE